MSNENESGGHWYTRDGSPAYTTNGRGTTLRDARKLKYVPSVTGVIGILEKPALINYFIEKAIKATVEHPPVDGETEAEYLPRLKTKARERDVEAAKEGSRIHHALECSFQGKAVPDQYIKHIDAAREAIAKQYPGVTDWVSEKTFAHPLGYGGACDLHSPSTGIVVDAKSKDGDFSDGKRLAYDQHFQLAAYQFGFGLPAAPSSALFISRTHPGNVSMFEWSAEEVADGCKTFLLCLELWKQTKGFDPGW